MSEETRELRFVIEPEERDALWALVKAHGLSKKIPPLKMAVMLKEIGELVISQSGAIQVESFEIPDDPKAWDA